MLYEYAPEHAMDIASQIEGAVKSTQEYENRSLAYNIN